MNEKPKIGFVGLCGESLFFSVDHFHRPGETLHAESFFMEPGGKGYNQAVAAQRLGAQSIFIGCVGRDAGGDDCEKFLVNEGAIALFERARDCATAYASILTDSRGENQVTVYRGASDKLSEAFVRSCEDKIAECKMMVLGLESPLDATLAAAEIAKNHNIPIVFNPAPAKAIDMKILKSFFIITPNKPEAIQIFGLSEDAEIKDIINAIRDNGFERCLVTLGGDGALLVDGEEAFLFPALPIKAVDTTGAGDTFNAALAVALSEGRSLRDAVEFATNASAHSVAIPHVMQSLPLREELEKKYMTCVPVKI